MSTIKSQRDNKITLKGYYESLGRPQADFRERIIKECGITIATFYRWMNGQSKPNKLQREKIEEIVKQVIFYPQAEEAVI